MNGIKQVLECAIATSNKVNVPKDGDYIKDDLLYCGKCHTPKQVKITLFGAERIVCCTCKCEMLAYEKEQEELRKTQQRVELRQRLEGIYYKAMLESKFEKDDGSNPIPMKRAKTYVQKFAQAKKENFGITFFGDTGTGKTFIASCIANGIINNGYTAYFTKFSDIIADMNDFSTGNNNEYIKKIDQYDLLIIDDFGAERNTETARQYVYDVINARYTSKKPIIITTNKCIEEMQSAKDMSLKRIYSRILEMTTFIKVDGLDKRNKKNKENLQKAKDFFEVE